MNDYPKPIKRQLRTLAAKAYETELEQALGELAEAFDLWRADKRSAAELSEKVHHFDIGPARTLDERYNTVQLNLLVAYALVTGLLKETDMPEEVWPFTGI